MDIIKSCVSFYLEALATIDYFVNVIFCERAMYKYNIAPLYDCLIDGMTMSFPINCFIVLNPSIHSNKNSLL